MLPRDIKKLILKSDNLKSIEKSCSGNDFKILVNILSGLDYSLIYGDLIIQLADRVNKMDSPGMYSFMLRRVFIEVYGFAAINKEFIDGITFLNTSILELGAGGGYISSEIARLVWLSRHMISIHPVRLAINMVLSHMLRLSMGTSQCSMDLRGPCFYLGQTMIVLLLVMLFSCLRERHLSLFMRERVVV